MKNRLAVCLILAAAALAPVPASAQGLLPPHEVTTSIRSMGLQPVSPPVRRGQRYELIAIDQRGVGVKVLADGFTGRVLFLEELDGPFRTTRANPDERRSDQRQGSVEPGEPSVIYAAPRETNPPRPPARVPSVAKPPVPKVAAKPPAKPAAPAEVTAAPETSAAASNESKESSDTTTGSTTAAASPRPAEKQPEKNPALTAPPVQGFD